MNTNHRPLTSAEDFVTLAATITGPELYTLAHAWTVNLPPATTQRRAWRLIEEEAAFHIWDTIGDQVLSRVYWTAPISDGLMAMRTAAIAVAARQGLTADEYAALIGPWESLAGPIG
ncbi:hypothetical protein ACFV1W_25210 [Kitasatospora sp. NPDC059648]|uniref:hypothetical protein n=1 Tax=Kitasatospora sp. NPDC059648 TaxID=3346894 RepID=UPI0036AE38EB